MTPYETEERQEKYIKSQFGLDSGEKQEFIQWKKNTYLRKIQEQQKT